VIRLATSIVKRCGGPTIVSRVSEPFSRKPSPTWGSVSLAWEPIK
jgi:hypothetical protein